MTALFGDRRRAFYAQARPVPLPPLAPEDCADFIQARFADTGKDVGTALAPLLALSAGHPQRTILMAHAVWEQTGTELRTRRRSAVARDLVLADLDDEFRAFWWGLPGGQRRVLVAVARGERPYSSTSVGGSRGGAVRAALGALVERAELEVDRSTVERLPGRGPAPGRLGRRPRLSPRLTRQEAPHVRPERLVRRCVVARGRPEPGAPDGLRARRWCSTAGEDGTAVALEDRCAHRGYPLSAGQVKGDSIECGYHGFAYGPDGGCTRVPAQSLIPKRAGCGPSRWWRRTAGSGCGPATADRADRRDGAGHALDERPRVGHRHPLGAVRVPRRPHPRQPARPHPRVVHPHVHRGRRLHLRARHHRRGRRRRRCRWTASCRRWRRRRCTPARWAPRGSTTASTAPSSTRRAICSCTPASPARAGPARRATSSRSSTASRRSTRRRPGTTTPSAATSPSTTRPPPRSSATGWPRSCRRTRTRWPCRRSACRAVRSAQRDVLIAQDAGVAKARKDHGPARRRRAGRDDGSTCADPAVPAEA